MLYSILILVATLPNSYLITFPPDWKQAWQPLPKCVWVSFLFLSFFFIIFPKLNFVLASRRPLGTSVISAFLFALALLSMAFMFRVRSKSTGCNSRKAWESLRKSDWWLGEDGEHPSSVYCVGAHVRSAEEGGSGRGDSRGQKTVVHTGNLGSGAPQTDRTAVKTGKSRKSTERQGLKWDSKDRTWSRSKFDISQWCLRGEKSNNNELGNKRMGFSSQRGQSLTFQFCVFWVLPRSLNFLSIKRISRLLWRHSLCSVWL